MTCLLAFESLSVGNSITCANNSEYLIRVGKVVLTAAATTNGSSFTLFDALYVPGIRKNLLSISALTRIRLVVKFIDDKCTVHDLSAGDTIVASGSLCHGLYKLNAYDRCVEDVACAVVDTQAISDAKLWHAHFGHLNFTSLMHFQKSEMVSSLPTLQQAPSRHVCEGYILGKMQRASFPEDGFVQRYWQITTYT